MEVIVHKDVHISVMDESAYRNRYELRWYRVFNVLREGRFFYFTGGTTNGLQINLIDAENNI